MKEMDGMCVSFSGPEKTAFVISQDTQVVGHKILCEHTMKGNINEIKYIIKIAAFHPKWLIKKPNNFNEILKSL